MAGPVDRQHVVLDQFKERILNFRPIEIRKDVIELHQGVRQISIARLDVVLANRSLNCLVGRHLGSGAVTEGRLVRPFQCLRLGCH